MKRFFGSLSLFLVACMVSAQTKINWQGYTWIVKTSKLEGPGPNDWSASNVWVDTQGYLHMRIAKVNGQWACAEIWTEQPMPFGTYQCHVEGRLDNLDPNIIFSMFHYEGPDGIKEIDIEYSKWGNPKDKNLWWTVWPNGPSLKQTDRGFEFHLRGSYTTSRYLWSSTQVKYGFLGGFQALGSDTNLMDSWSYAPTDYEHRITQTPMPLHFNLWLFKGRPPMDGKPVEIVVHDFTYSPLSAGG